MRLGLGILAPLVSLVAAGCHARAPVGYTRISADNHELVRAFDDAADDVRVILLVSPS